MDNIDLLESITFLYRDQLQLFFSTVGLSKKCSTLTGPVASSEFFSAQTHFFTSLGLVVYRKGRTLRFSCQTIYL